MKHLLLSITLILSTPLMAKTVTMMTFNVENLFDTTHDEGKNDYSYLPFEFKDNDEQRERCAPLRYRSWRNQCLFMDWNEEVLDLKMRRIADTIKMATEDGLGADIVFLQEVENRRVLAQMIHQYLSESDYRIVLLEGSDLRGVDVAILTRLEVIGRPRIYTTRFEGAEQAQIDDTRPILRVKVQLDDDHVLSLFSVHFPAAHLPRRMRAQQFTHLKNLMDRAQSQGEQVVAAGDFNVVKSEAQEINMFKTFMGEHYLASHFFMSGDDIGTHHSDWEGSHWSWLDAFVISRELFDENSYWRADPHSIHVATNNPDQYYTANGGIRYPQRFRVSTDPDERTLPQTGVSDHFPLMMNLTNE